MLRNYKQSKKVDQFTNQFTSNISLTIFTEKYHFSVFQNSYLNNFTQCALYYYKVKCRIVYSTPLKYFVHKIFTSKHLSAEITFYYKNVFCLCCSALKQVGYSMVSSILLELKWGCIIYNSLIVYPFSHAISIPK